MRRTVLLLLVLALVASIAGPGHGKVVTKTLGTDPVGDGPPALDITYLKVGRLRADLYIEIGVDKMIPPFGGYPAVPGIEWVFDVKDRTFVAEAVADRTPAFYLFEVMEDGSVVQLESPKGGYAYGNGYIHILVPLETLEAGKGTVISGTEDYESGADVDAHVHAGGTFYADVMTTTRDFVVP